MERVEAPENVCICCSQSCSNHLTCTNCKGNLHEACAERNDQNQAVCSLCHHKTRMDLERNGALEGLQQQAKRMKLMSDKKFGEVEIGKTVRIPIPDVDRGRGDHGNVLGIILGTTDEGYYQIGTKTGRLNKLYARSQFSVCEENLMTIDQVPNCALALRSVANAQSNGTGQGMFRCNCKSKCNTNKCTCKKNNLLCNSRCHQSVNCFNK